MVELIFKLFFDIICHFFWGEYQFAAQGVGSDLRDDKEGAPSAWVSAESEFERVDGALKGMFY